MSLLLCTCRAHALRAVDGQNPLVKRYASTSVMGPGLPGSLRAALQLFISPAGHVRILGLRGSSLPVPIVVRQVGYYLLVGTTTLFFLFIFHVSYRCARAQRKRGRKRERGSSASIYAHPRFLINYRACPVCMLLATHIIKDLLHFLLL